MKTLTCKSTNSGSEGYIVIRSPHLPITIFSKSTTWEKNLPCRKTKLSVETHKKRKYTNEYTNSNEYTDTTRK